MLPKIDPIPGLYVEPQLADRNKLPDDLLNCCSGGAIVAGEQEALATLHLSDDLTPGHITGSETEGACEES